MTNNRFGVLEFLNWDHEWNMHHYRQEGSVLRCLDLVRDAGIGWVRLDFLWQDIEPAKGNFDFSRQDALVKACRDRQVNVLGVLGYSALWAAKDGTWNGPLQDPACFAVYAQRTAQRYKDSVAAWEVWNEPDSPVYWSGQDGLKSYCSLLKGAYPAIKAASPKSTVMHGGFALGPASVEQLYLQGAQGYFDAVNIHVFKNPLDAEAAGWAQEDCRRTARIMARYGDTRKKIWVTEAGCPGVAARAGAVPGWWLGKNPDEEEQAQWLAASMQAIAGEPQVEKVFWAFFRDTDRHWGDGTDYLGIIRNDFSLKPAYEAYKKLIKEKNAEGVPQP